MQPSVSFARFAFGFGGVNGFLAVILGAWSSHAQIGEVAASSVAIAVNYQLVHSLLLIVCGVVLLWRERSDKTPPLSLTGLRMTVVFLSLGIILFSWLISLKHLVGFGVFSALTPFGGVCFMLAWLSIAIIGVRLRKVI